MICFQKQLQWCFKPPCISFQEAPSRGPCSVSRSSRLLKARWKRSSVTRRRTSRTVFTGTPWASSKALVPCGCHIRCAMLSEWLQGTPFSHACFGVGDFALIHSKDATSWNSICFPPTFQVETAKLLLADMSIIFKGIVSNSGQRGIFGIQIMQICKWLQSNWPLKENHRTFIDATIWLL